MLLWQILQLLEKNGDTTSVTLIRPEGSNRMKRSVRNKVEAASEGTMMIMVIDVVVAVKDLMVELEDTITVVAIMIELKVMAEEIEMEIIKEEIMTTEEMEEDKGTGIIEMAVVIEVGTREMKEEDDLSN
jgi:hypothetical protein